MKNEDRIKHYLKISQFSRLFKYLSPLQLLCIPANIVACFRALSGWLVFIIVFAPLQASSQMIFKIESLHKKDKIELRNFYKDRLVSSINSNREKTIEIDLEHSDSLVIINRGSIPVVLLNLKLSNFSVINFELPDLPEYYAVDTLYEYVTKKRAFSNKRTGKDFEYFPNNSRKLDLMPQSIEVMINGIPYRGNMIRNHSISFLNADGKNFSLDRLSMGIEAIYVVQFSDD